MNILDTTHNLERSTNVEVVNELPKNQITIKETGLDYIDAGLSVIPVNKDKQATVEWKQFKNAPPSPFQYQQWSITPEHGIAIICGNGSGHIEVIDFDEKYNLDKQSLFERWKKKVEEQKPGLVERLVWQSTRNKGYHAIYRCRVIEGNKKLAMRPATESESDVNAQTLIETRGAGEYFLVSPSNGYKILNGSLFHIPEITPEEREILFECARALNQYIPPSSIVTGIVKKIKSSKGILPGEDFNARGEIRSLLEESGWKKVGEDAEREQWSRPGKQAGTSATFHKDMQTFYVFSTNVVPFENEKAYSKFAVYTLLKHNGDYNKAAKALVTEGYGERDIQNKQQNQLVMLEEYLNDQYNFRYNVITQHVEFRKEGNGEFTNVEEVDFNSMYRELHHHDLPVQIDAFHRLLESDYSKKINPFEEYFSNLSAWDSQADPDYINQLAETITLQDEEERKSFKTALRRWLIAQVACALEPEAVNQTAIILVGEQQGAGKTSWLNKLIPPPLTRYKYVGTIYPDNKDTLIYLSETMLINLDEMETLKKADIGVLKSIMTMTSVKVRRPYARYPVDMVRRASFVGSINNATFLTDPTGSRRFLTFEVKDINYNHTIDMNNVYAQAYALYKSGERYWFDSTEITDINERNKKFTVLSYENELVNECFEPGDVAKNDGEWRTSTDVADRLHICRPDFKVDRESVKRIGYALTNEKYPRKSSNKGTRYYIKK